VNALARRFVRGGVAAFVPVALGACFYLFLRAREAWFVSRALASPSVGPSLRAMRASTLASVTWIPSLVDDVAPDFLWALAVGGMLRALNGSRAWMIVGLASVVGYELAQRWQLVAGTFDPKDLVAQVVGFAIGWRVFAWSKVRSFRTAEARTSTA
jgi:hypothetical protein